MTDVAQRSGLSLTTLSLTEAGRRAISARVLAAYEALQEESRTVASA